MNLKKSSRVQYRYFLDMNFIHFFNNLLTKCWACLRVEVGYLQNIPENKVSYVIGM